MNETLLQAERLLSVGLLDQAAALYFRSLEQQPDDAVALVGLARVSVERGDDRAAHAYAVRAVAGDSQNAAARAMEARLAELLRARGELLPRTEPGSREQPDERTRQPAERTSRPRLLRRMLGR